MRLTGKAATTCDTPIRDGFVVTQRHVTQGRRQQLIRECTRRKFDSATRAHRDTLDSRELARALIREYVSDWSGLTVPVLTSVAPLVDGEEIDVDVDEASGLIACKHTGVAYRDRLGLFGDIGEGYTLPEFIYNRAKPEHFGRLLADANDAMDEAEVEADEKKSAA